MKCPRCGAPDKYPNAPKTKIEYGQVRNRPTIFECGTVTSPYWSPPVYDKNCQEKRALPPSS